MLKDSEVDYSDRTKKHESVVPFNEIDEYNLASFG